MRKYRVKYVIYDGDTWADTTKDIIVEAESKEAVYDKYNGYNNEFDYLCTISIEEVKDDNSI